MAEAKLTINIEVNSEKGIKELEAVSKAIEEVRKDLSSDFSDPSDEAEKGINSLDQSLENTQESLNETQQKLKQDFSDPTGSAQKGISELKKDINSILLDTQSLRSEFNKDLKDNTVNVHTGNEALRKKIKDAISAAQELQGELKTELKDPTSSAAQGSEELKRKYEALKQTAQDIQGELKQNFSDPTGTASKGIEQLQGAIFGLQQDAKSLRSELQKQLSDPTLTAQQGSAELKSKMTTVLFEIMKLQDELKKDFKDPTNPAAQGSEALKQKLSALQQEYQALNSKIEKPLPDPTPTLKTAVEGLNVKLQNLSNAFNIAQSVQAFGQSLISGAQFLSDLGEKYQTLQARISNLQGSDMGAAVMNELTNVAIRTNASLEASAQLYARIAYATGNAGDGATSLIKITEGLNNALRLSGTTGSDASGALLQLSQAFNAGRLNGDEFRSVSENMPIVLRAISQEMGVTQGELKKLGSQGKITTDIMVQAILNMEQEWKEKAANLPTTFNQSLENIKTSWMNFLSESAASQSVLSLLGDALKFLSDTAMSVVGVLNQIVSGLSQFHPSVLIATAAVAAFLQPWLLIVPAIVAVVYAFEGILDILNSVGAALGAVGAAVSALLSGEFSLIPKILNEWWTEGDRATQTNQKMTLSVAELEARQQRLAEAKQSGVQAVNQEIESTAGLEEVYQGNAASAIELKSEVEGLTEQLDDYYSSAVRAQGANDINFAEQGTPPGMAHGGIIGASQADLTAAAMSGALDVPHFAEGGIVDKPTVALIGEEGTEHIVPMAGGGRVNPDKQILKEIKEKIQMALAEKSTSILDAAESLTFNIQGPNKKKKIQEDILDARVKLVIEEITSAIEVKDKERLYNTESDINVIKRASPIKAAPLLDKYDDGVVSFIKEDIGIATEIKSWERLDQIQDHIDIMGNPDKAVLMQKELYNARAKLIETEINQATETKQESLFPPIQNKINELSGVAPDKSILVQQKFDDAMAKIVLELINDVFTNKDSKMMESIQSKINELSSYKKATVQEKFNNAQSKLIHEIIKNRIGGFETADDLTNYLENVSKDLSEYPFAQSTIQSEQGKVEESLQKDSSFINKLKTIAKNTHTKWLETAKGGETFNFIDKVPSNVLGNLKSDQSSEIYKSFSNLRHPGDVKEELELAEIGKNISRVLNAIKLLDTNKEGYRLDYGTLMDNAKKKIPVFYKELFNSLLNNSELTFTALSTQIGKLSGEYDNAAQYFPKAQYETEMIKVLTDSKSFLGRVEKFSKAEFSEIKDDTKYKSTIPSSLSGILAPLNTSAVSKIVAVWEKMENPQKADLERRKNLFKSPNASSDTEHAEGAVITPQSSDTDIELAEGGIIDDEEIIDYEEIIDDEEEEQNQGNVYIKPMAAGSVVDKPTITTLGKNEPEAIIPLTKGPINLFKLPQYSGPQKALIGEDGAEVRMPLSQVPINKDGWVDKNRLPAMASGGIMNSGGGGSVAIDYTALANALKTSLNGMTLQVTLSASGIAQAVLTSIKTSKQNFG